MIVTNKLYSHPRVTVIQIDIHLAGGNPTNTDGRGGQEARGWVTTMQAPTTVPVFEFSKPVNFI
jgi:hypothetical protein